MGAAGCVFRWRMGRLGAWLSGVDSFPVASVAVSAASVPALAGGLSLAAVELPEARDGQIAFMFFFLFGGGPSSPALGGSGWKLEDAGLIDVVVLGFNVKDRRHT